MKTAIVARILAVRLMCPDCQGVCSNADNGSSMIGQDECATVFCDDCGKKWKVPQRVFAIPKYDQYQMASKQNARDYEAAKRNAIEMADVVEPSDADAILKNCSIKSEPITTKPECICDNSDGLVCLCGECYSCLWRADAGRRVHRILFGE